MTACRKVGEVAYSGGGMNRTTYDSDEFASAFDAAFARLREHIGIACESENEWPRQMAAGVRAALEFATADPDAAHTLTGRAIAQGSEGYASYDRMISHFGRYLLRGRDMRSDGRRLPEFTEKALVGGLTMLIAQRLNAGRTAELPGAAAEATQFLLTPYLGADEARRAAAGRGV